MSPTIGPLPATPPLGPEPSLPWPRRSTFAAGGTSHGAD
jgi:hypothetical protein